MAKGRIVVLWGDASPFVRAEVERGIDEALAEVGWHLLRVPLSAETIRDGGAPAVERLRLEADGLLAALVEPDPEAVSALDRLGLPVVLVGAHRTDLGRGSVSIDHVGGARRAVGALVDLGRRRIGYVGPGPEAGRIWADRLAGARAAAEEARLPLVFEGETSFEIEEAGLATRRLLERAPETDALVCPTDLQALGAMRMLREMGVVVPNDIAVIGFDDTEAARAASPPLSSVRQPFAALGAAGVRMLVRAAGGETGDLGREVLPIDLVLRESCLPAGPRATEGWSLRADGRLHGPFAEEALATILRPRTLVQHPRHAPEGRRADEVPHLRPRIRPVGPALEWWFVRRRGREEGPITRAALLSLVDRGDLRAEDEVRHGVEGTFRPVSSTRLAGRLRSADLDLSGLGAEEILAGPAGRGPAAAPPPARGVRREVRPLAAVAAVFATFLTVLLLTWAAHRRPSPTEGRFSAERLGVRPPPPSAMRGTE